MFGKAFEILKNKKKLVLTFVFIFALFFIMTPGVFFKLPPQKNEPDGSFKASKVSAGIHALLYSIIVTIFIYFLNPSSASCPISPSSFA